MEAKEEERRTLLTNRNFGLALTAASLAALAYYTQQDWVFQRLRDGFYLGLLTLVSVVWILLCAVMMVFDHHRKDTIPAVGTFFSPYVPLVFAIPLAGYVLFWATEYVGFPPALWVFCGLAVYALGLRPMKSAVISGFVMMAVIYGLFAIIGEPLPLGALGAWIGSD